MATKNSKAPDSTSPDLQQQTETFNRAMEYFHQRDFRKAMALFDAATNGPVREMAYSARTHLRMCESRLSKSEPEARSAEENYNHGIAQMNLRSFANAAALFEISVKQSETDYAHYALAAALGHQGQVDQAVRHLQRAIQMQPRNRAMAASDPDFIELAKFQPIRDILTGS